MNATAQAGGTVAGDYDGIELFSATKFQDRDNLGKKVSGWIQTNPSLKVVATVITQSSDEQFHCVCITLFFKGKVTVPYRPDNGGRDRG